MQKTKKPWRSPGKNNRVRRGKVKSLSAQQTIPYLVMHPDGVCQLPGGIYTKTVEYEDINYSVASTEDQTAIFGGWSSFLNDFDCSLPFQLSFVNRRSRSISRYKVNMCMGKSTRWSMRMSAPRAHIRRRSWARLFCGMEHGLPKSRYGSILKRLSTRLKASTSRLPLTISTEPPYRNTRK